MQNKILKTPLPQPKLLVPFVYAGVVGTPFTLKVDVILIGVEMVSTPVDEFKTNTLVPST
jgi:hypothetical protein